jgi:cellulose synthase/poly-beta-1,6-N-acetylglucosamine synthase-like glycosyltransferase
VAIQINSLFQSAGHDLDELCVVIPARNEELLVSRCIASVMAAGVPANQIYVVNDCSTDSTGAVLAGIDGINVLTNEQRLGKSLGLRSLISQFRLHEHYSYLSLLDADSTVAPEYFNEVVRTFRKDPAFVVVCGAPRSERHNWLTAFRALEYLLSAAMYRPGQDALGMITVAPGCAATYRTSILNRLDWDGGTLVEDMDLTVQVHRKHLGRIGFSKDAIAYTQDPKQLRDYVGQITRWHSGTWQVMKRHRLPFGRQRVDFEFALLVGEGLVYSLLVMLLPLLLVVSPGAVMRWLLLDQALVVAGAAYCAAVTRRLDVILWAPSYTVLRFLNSAIFLKTFWQEIVRQRSLGSWFSVQRYNDVAAAGVAGCERSHQCVPS